MQCEKAVTRTPHTRLKRAYSHSGGNIQALHIAHNINQLKFSNYVLQTYKRKSLRFSVCNAYGFRFRESF